VAETSVQASLFDADVKRPERIVMALNPEYYDLIWARLKRHEFRRRFVEGHPVEWFVYLTAPVSRLAAVVDLGAAVIDAPEVIAALAEQARPGNGASVLAYVRDLSRAFAMPIRRVREYSGLDTEALRAELGTFHPPQGYIRVAHNPGWSRVCDGLVATALVRQMTVDHAVSGG
jgi:predicted transcriptional regulator